MQELTPTYRRGPQKRDYMAEASEGLGLGLGCGRSWERAIYVTKKVVAMKAEGRGKDAQLLEDAINVSKRGAWEIARLSEEAFSTLCEMVTDGDAPNLIVALRLCQEIKARGLIEGVPALDPITLVRLKDDKYRIVSQHNHSSVVVSAHDLIYLQGLIDYIMPELTEKTNEDPGSSEE